MKVFIGTGSVTYSTKAVRVLESAGIRCKPVRRAQESITGCGWGVEADVADVENVVKLLADSDVRITVVKRDGA